ncbi:thermonuclease family protein [Paraliomyxa miuraensis]|uniref:thermonuclease family protein n=1 Tax=Paraliomyxa miuraensis TaxID=376150 RepID=UPI0022565BF7|nr:thermonuclease family protein [Paraliomyxa miuraensis]MCX4245246.1 thermonuclease family protein [Paraliomyxa miuraensis]
MLTSITPSKLVPAAVAGLLAGLVLGTACETEQPPNCGPTEAVVTRVIDGDTIEIDAEDPVTGTPYHIRYLLVDTPETSGTAECYGFEAKDFNRSIVEGKTVRLSYDDECTDRYDRLLAYVELADGRSVNELLIERGLACVLHIPPNGSDRVDEYRAAEDRAQAGMVGLWGACVGVEAPCG